MIRHLILRVPRRDHNFDIHPYSQFEGSFFAPDQSTDEVRSGMRDLGSLQVWADPGLGTRVKGLGFRV